MVGELGETLEDLVEAHEYLPGRQSRDAGDTSYDQLLEVLLTAALPDLVGKGDEQVLERRIVRVPACVGSSEASLPRGSAAREQQRVTIALVLTPRPDQLVRVQRLADVVRRRPEGYRATVEDERRPGFRERDDEPCRDVVDSSQVSDEARRGSDRDEELDDGRREGEQIEWPGGRSGRREEEGKRKRWHGRSFEVARRAAVAFLRRGGLPGAVPSTWNST